jgi:hypothetical protein
MMVLDLMLDSISELRKPFGSLPLGDFTKALCEARERGNIDDDQNGRLASLYSFIKMPRTEVYKVPSDLVVPNICSDDLNAIFSFGAFRRPWLAQIIFPDGDEFVMMHSMDTGGNHLFSEYSYSEGIVYDAGLGVIDSNGDFISVNIPNEEQVDLRMKNIAWMMRVFNAMRIKKYIDVKGGVGKTKNKMNRSPSKVVRYTLSLNEEGRRYHSQHLATANTHWKNGKEQMPIEIGTFQRRQRVGKGRQEVKIVDVRPHERKQWVVPKDKITKLIA